MSTIMARRPKSTYSAAPEGLHAACCVDVVDLGIVQGAYGAKHKVRIVWQLDLVDEALGRRYDVARAYTLSLHERAALRKDLESWRGRRFTEAELDGFDLEKLLGAPAQVAITHSVADDGTIYANVSTVVPPVKGTPRLVPLDFTRWKDRATVRSNGNGIAPTEANDVPF